MLKLVVFQEEIFASSFAAAAYLKSIDFPKDKKVLVSDFLQNKMEYIFAIIFRCAISFLNSLVHLTPISQICAES